MISNQSYAAYKHHIETDNYLLAAAWCYENLGDIGQRWQVFGLKNFGFRDDYDATLFALAWGAT